MKANYHTHTSRCHHAKGTETEYIETALKRGLTTLGFSDHAPYFYPDGYVSFYKMTPEELPDYKKTLLDLRNKYSGTIDIKIGLEAEYYPQIWDEALKLWQTLGIEYLVLGQHFINEEWTAGAKSSHYSGGVDNVDNMTRYVDICCRALDTGKFTIFAHPDIFEFSAIEDKELAENEIKRLVSCAIRNDVPLEINLLGLRDGRRYPSEFFWDIASKLHPRVILGCDAHSPDTVADEDNVREALKFAKRFGITPCEHVEFKPI